VATETLSSDPQPAWLTAGVRGIGGASLLSDLGHEVPTSLLPSLLTSTLHVPAAALGVIEGIADGPAVSRASAAGPWLTIRGVDAPLRWAVMPRPRCSPG
jgi:hypothetical protein